MKNNEQMHVLMVRPGAYPEQITIGTKNEDLQKIVGGNFEVWIPFADVSDECAIVLNEAGKPLGLPLNRVIRSEDGTMQDIIAGTFLIVGLRNGNLESLSPQLLERFERRFHRPERFMQVGLKTIAIPIPDDEVKNPTQARETPSDQGRTWSRLLQRRRNRNAGRD